MAQEVQCSFQRYEKKYLLTRAQYEFLRARFQAHLREDQYGRYTICNIYYDTPDFQLIRKSLEKPVYKEKLRMRSYGVPHADSPVFVEIKKKFDGVVYKRRAVMGASAAVDYLDGSRPPEEDQICHEISWFRDRWQPRPQVFIAYDREALADKDGGELRVTFDTDLRWRDTELDLRAGDHGSPLLPSDQVLMEIKIPGVAPVWLARLLSEAKAFPTTFSKYGTCYRDHLSNRPLENNLKVVRFCA